MAKFDKAASYLPDSGPPCEESTRRERVFLENVVAIEKHNAERARGRFLMKARRDSLRGSQPDEFANHHGHAHAGADEGLVGVGKSERASVAGAAEHGLEAPREVHVAAQGDGPSPNARGTTLPVAKLGAGGDPRVASRLGIPIPREIPPLPTPERRERLRTTPPPPPDPTRRSGTTARRLSRKLCATPRRRAPRRTSRTRRRFPSSSSASARRRRTAARRRSRAKRATGARSSCCATCGTSSSTTRARGEGRGWDEENRPRFADLTPDEFAANHATYVAGVNVAPRRDENDTGVAREGGRAPRRALEGKNAKGDDGAENRPKSSADGFFAATDAALGWSTGLASLGDEAPGENERAVATLGAEAAEPALLSEEEDLAAEAAAIFARDLSAARRRTPPRQVFDDGNARPMTSSTSSASLTERPSARGHRPAL